MTMREDFGDYGDEIFLNHCAEDYLENDRLLWQERQREREVRAADLAEEEVDNAWDAMNERDLCDMVREHEEQEDWTLEADDLQEWRTDEEDEEYYDCDWEE